MNKKEILAKAIDKAVANGWDNGEQLKDFEMEESIDAGNIGQFPIKHLQLEIEYENWISIESVIYDHDFALALWGEDIEEINVLASSWTMDQLMRAQPAWQYHLQRMVVAENPLEYLAEHI